MTTRWQWSLLRLARKVWVKAVAYGVLGILTALAAVLVAPWLPDDLDARIGADAVDQLLNILASSMLAVTTFSVSIMLSAFGTAATGATPRATALLKEDNTTQQVLSSFVGAFLFALVGIIALKADVYGAGGRAVLFVVTVGVLAVVVAALLRWIAHLMDFGRLCDTLDRVETATAGALAKRLAAPFLGGRPLLGAPHPETHAVLASDIGYVEHVDMAKLHAVAVEQGADIWLTALPGTFVHRAAALIHSAVPCDEEATQRVRAAFSVGHDRTFDQDPRFGLIVLAESASRALSPSVNDPGTAIAVLGRLVRLLSVWTDPSEAEVCWPRVYVPPIRVSDMLEDAFRPVARDGAGLIEVQVRLQKALYALAASAPQVFALGSAEHASEALKRAQVAGLTPTEIDLLRPIVQETNALAHSLVTRPLASC